MRLEITQPVALNDRQRIQLEMHSFINAMSVLIGELSLLQALVTNPHLLQASLTATQRLHHQLQNPADAMNAADSFRSLRNRITHQMNCAEDSFKVAQTGFGQQTIQNIHGIFSVIDVRVHEILARAARPKAWKSIPLLSLRDNLTQWLAAIEHNAKGRYHFSFDPAKLAPDTYVIVLNLAAEDGTAFWMPSIFQDVIRDLLANARKYSAPGTTILVSMQETADAIHLLVRDEGRGIPQEEMLRVVEFGHRASNALHVRTHGGGYGLTKAWVVTREFGGRMWIESGEDKGTLIEIELPRPSLAMAS